MAQAFRTVWLEPEEQQISPTPSLRPRRPARMVVVVRRVGCVILACLLLMTAAIAYIHAHAQIAQYEFERQALNTRLNLLHTESEHLKLDIAALDNAGQIEQVAQQESMVFPTADRVQYVTVATAFSTDSSQQAALAPQRSWLGQAGHLLVDRLDNIFQRFGHGPGVPAYAQE